MLPLVSVRVSLVFPPTYAPKACLEPTEESTGESHAVYYYTVHEYIETGNIGQGWQMHDPDVSVHQYVETKHCACLFNYNAFYV